MPRVGLMCGHDILVSMVSGYRVPLATGDGICELYLGPVLTCDVPGRTSVDTLSEEMSILAKHGHFGLRTAKEFIREMFEVQSAKCNFLHCGYTQTVGSTAMKDAAAGEVSSVSDSEVEHTLDDCVNGVWLWEDSYISKSHELSEVILR